MLKKLDLLFGFLGLLFVLLIAWDCYKSDSHLPEGLLYTAFREPNHYPNEIKTDINQIQSSVDQKVEARTSEIAKEIKKQIEDSKTGCISFSGLPNAVCFGVKQSASR